MLKSIVTSFQSLAQEFTTPTQANNEHLKTVQDTYQAELSTRIGPIHPGFDYDVRLVPAKQGLPALSFADPSAPGRKDTVASYVVPSFRAKPAIEVTDEIFTKYSQYEALAMMRDMVPQIIDHKWRKEGLPAQRIAFDETYTGDKLPAPKTNS